MVSGEVFEATAGQLMQRYADFQLIVRDQAKATADSLHMPTKDDLAALATLVINLERKVDDLLVGLAENGAGEAPLARLEKKLDAIDERLNSLATPPAKKPAPKRSRSTSSATTRSKSAKRPSGSDD